MCLFLSQGSSSTHRPIRPTSAPRTQVSVHLKGTREAKDMITCDYDTDVGAINGNGVVNLGCKLTWDNDLMLAKRVDEGQFAVGIVSRACSPGVSVGILGGGLAGVWVIGSATPRAVLMFSRIPGTIGSVWTGVPVSPVSMALVLAS